MRCSKCGEPASVPLRGAQVLYIGSPVTARGSGIGSFCPACQAAYCSLHAAWAQPELPDELVPGPEGPQVLLAHCPDCGGLTGGADGRA